MADYSKAICELTLKYRDSKELVVRKAVITLIPSMATYDSDEFEAHYLDRSMGYLFQALSKATDRDIGMWRHQCYVYWPHVLQPTSRLGTWQCN